ncbi:MAG: hypothetical protein AAGD35_14410 [Actinomycetota bacterium]
MKTARLLPLLLGSAFLVSACTGGPGSRDDLVAALTRDDSFTQAEASCIADAIFAEYGEDEDALSVLSGSASYSEISSASEVEGFDEFFDNTISACTNR